MKTRWLIFALFTSFFILWSCHDGGRSFKESSNDFTQTLEQVEYEEMITEEAVEEIEADFNTESYATIIENDFLSPLANPLSTFSIDVDAASYTNTRRFINDGSLPPADAVRIEEFINYFDYNYPAPSSGNTFNIYTELGKCPWNSDHKLLHIGIKGKDIPEVEIKHSNLVFLIDVSGSMSDRNKLPLLKRSVELLVDNLNAEDRIAIVTYAGNAGLVLNSTSCNDKRTIKRATNRLNAGGSTAGSAGLKLAYEVAVNNFIADGNNRIILATDGDFNIGPSSDGEMYRLIETNRDKGVFITVLGFGMGNYKDSKMETIADHGNGNYFYIDELKEARRVLADNIQGTLYAIAKDVKIQVEFNPAKVKEYRLIGYENRLMEAHEFDDDTKDAGELGAGHTVTAIYQIVPGKAAGGQSLKYQQQSELKGDLESQGIGWVKIRHKNPEGGKSMLTELEIKDKMLAKTSNSFRFSSAVAAYALILRDSKYKGTATIELVTEIAKNAIGEDEFGLRNEFIAMVRDSKYLLEKRISIVEEE